MLPSTSNRNETILILNYYFLSKKTRCLLPFSHFKIIFSAFCILSPNLVTEWVRLGIILYTKTPFSLGCVLFVLVKPSTNLHHRPLNLTRTNWIRHHSNVAWDPLICFIWRIFMPRSSCRTTSFYVNAAVSFAARTGLFYCHVLFFILFF